MGYLRTHYPLFGRIPDGAVTFMTSLGLAAFVGLTGIQAGPIFLSALKEVGIGLFLGGIVVTLLPQVIGLSFGHFALRMNPIMLLGALAGGQTVTAAMAAVQERSGSPVAVLGYPSVATVPIHPGIDETCNLQEVAPDTRPIAARGRSRADVRANVE